MPSYWYYYFEAEYTPCETQTKIKGDGVIKFEKNSFLPRTLINTIKEAIKKWSDTPPKKELLIFIKGFGKIDRAGYEDYTKQSPQKVDYSINFNIITRKNLKIYFNNS